MKVLYLISIIAITPLTLGCNPKFTQFFMDYNSAATIPASQPVNLPFDVSTPDQTTNSSFKFEVNDTRKDKIEKITLEDLEISIVSPEGETFSFLKNISIYISANGIQEKLVAYKYDISNSIGGKIVCNTKKEDLQAYVKADAFEIRLEVETDELISQDTQINIYSNFFVDAKLIK